MGAETEKSSGGDAEEVRFGLSRGLRFLKRMEGKDCSGRMEEDISPDFTLCRSRIQEKGGRMVLAGFGGRGRCLYK